jgi:hypothetical protein
MRAEVPHSRWVHKVVALAVTFDPRAGPREREAREATGLETIVVGGQASSLHRRFRCRRAVELSFVRVRELCGHGKLVVGVD